MNIAFLSTQENSGVNNTHQQVKVAIRTPTSEMGREVVVEEQVKNEINQQHGLLLRSPTDDIHP